MNKILEAVKVINAVTPANAQAVTSTYVSAMGYRRFVGVGQASALTNAKILTVQLMQATDASAGGAKVLGTAGTFTSAGAVVNGRAVAEARETSLDTNNGYTYVAVAVSHDEGANKLMSGLLLMEAIKQPETV